MFASKTTRTVEVKDGDATVVVTIQKLSRRALEASSDARQRKVAQVAKDMGAEIVQAYQARAAKDEAEKVLDPVESRFATYDVETVLVNGITSWSASVPVAEGIPDLDVEVSDILFRAIVTLSVPTPAEAEEELGKP